MAAASITGTFGSVEILTKSGAQRRLLAEDGEVQYTEDEVVYEPKASGEPTASAPTASSTNSAATSSPTASDASTAAGTPPTADAPTAAGAPTSAGSPTAADTPVASDSTNAAGGSTTGSPTPSNEVLAPENEIGYFSAAVPFAHTSATAAALVLAALLLA